MSQFNEHIKQARSNLKFLEHIGEIQNYWDWKVTTCFYSGVHLINAHISASQGDHYRSHSRTESAINPFNTESASRLDENVFTAYRSLYNLSRRSRYLIHENTSNTSVDHFMTYDKHYSKALRHLDTLIKFMKVKYSIDFDTINVSCPSLTNTSSFAAYELK